MSQPVPEVPYGGPEVPYGGADPTPAAGRAPQWLSRLFDEPGTPGDTGVGTSVLLVEPPRGVPLAYRLSALSLSGWGVFTVLMVMVAPMAVWITSPLLRTLALVVLTAVLVVTRVRRYRRVVGLLRWGKVATVTDTRPRTSRTSFTNWPMRRATGWDVTTVLFTGSGSTTDVTYLVDNQTGTVTVRGLPYTDGVVIADSRHPERAMVVSQFPHSVKPGIDGRFVGRLAPGRWLWTVVSLALVAGLVALTVWSLSDLVRDLRESGVDPASVEPLVGRAAGLGHGGIVVGELDRAGSVGLEAG